MLQGADCYLTKHFQTTRTSKATEQKHPKNILTPGGLSPKTQATATIPHYISNRKCLRPNPHSLSRQAHFMEASLKYTPQPLQVAQAIFLIGASKI